MRHPLDPVPLHERAERLGESLAENVISFESVREICAAWAQGQSQVDKSGLQSRLVGAAVDTASARLRAMANAEMSLRWAVRPLLASRAPVERIEAAALRAAGDVLSRDEIRAVLAEEWQRAQPRRRVR